VFLVLAVAGGLIGGDPASLDHTSHRYPATTAERRQQIGRNRRSAGAGLASHRDDVVLIGVVVMAVAGVPGGLRDMAGYPVAELAER
jgi:hypothetical protein